jgi:gliding motility-associated-like protein
MNITGNLRHLAEFVKKADCNFCRLVLFLVINSFIGITSICAQVVTDFSCNDSTGCDILNTGFINKSQGSNLSFSWNFGNGILSNEPNPQIIYSSTGSYTVQLIVSDGSTSDTLTKPNYIHVYHSPVASFLSNSVKIGCSPLHIGFTNTSILGDAPLNSFLWDFGDGSSGTLANPVHSYTKVGSYDVSVYVSDTNQCEGNATIENFIKVTLKPSVGFTAIKTITCLDTLTVMFLNNSSGVTDLTFQWDFGDSSTSNIKDPSHFYSGYSKNAVKLTATDQYGCSDSLIKTDYIELQKLNAYITIENDTVCPGQNLAIENTTSGATNSFWDFGDGTSSNQFVPLKTFTDTGSIEIKYIAIFKNVCYDTVILPIYVDPLIASFETDKNYICELPAIVNYTSLSSGANKWEWHLGNGDFSMEENPEITFQMSPQIRRNPVAYYSDSLIVQSNFGCRDTAAKYHNIYLNVPTVAITPNDSNIYINSISGCVPITVQFKDKSKSNNPGDPLVNWEWDFGDGSNSALHNPTHIFNSTGIFDVKFTVTNNSGCVNSTSIAIRTGTPQNALFTYTGDEIACGSKKVQFTNLSTDATLINKWEWEISDGSTYNVPEPNIFIRDTGYISATLKVFYNNCPSNIYHLDSLFYIKGPAGYFDYQMNCPEPYKYNFISRVEGADQWFWDFGDGQFDSLQNQIVEHIYAGSNTYLVNLTSVNAETNCQLINSLFISPRDIKAGFEFSTPVGCIGQPIAFDPEGSIDEEFFVSYDTLAKYLWTIGNVPLVRTSNDIYFHTFNSAGDQEITLTVYAINNCSGQITKKVHINQLVSDFSFNQNQGCAPLVVNFTDHTISDTAIVKWDWEFGPGINSDEQNPIVTFNQQAAFNIRLITTDASNCTDTVTKQQTLTVLKPYVDFAANSIFNCNGSEVNFTNNILESIQSFYWDFGDGTFTNLQNPKHIFPDTGKYTISLRVVDSLGCDSTITKLDYIQIEPLPIANFDVSNLYSNCYPSIIGFNDQSVSDDIKMWFWEFGDGAHLEQNPFPFHTYIKPRYYNVSLIVKTSIGCSDTIIKSNVINIGGPHVDIEAPDSFCINIPADIHFINPINVYQFEWVDDAGLRYEDDSINITYSNPGTKRYYLSLKSDGSGTCDKLFTDSIIIPQLTANFSISESEGCIPLFSGVSSTTVGANKLEWFMDDDQINNAQKFDILFDNAGKFAIKLRAANSIGCKDSLIKTITAFPLPDIKLTNDTTICQYDTVQLLASGGETYFWSGEIPIQDPTSADIWVSPLNPIKYYVSVTDSNQCNNIDSIFVNVQPKPSATIIGSDTIELIIGEEITLESQQEYGDNIYWLPADFLSCSTCGSTAAIPLNSMTYYFNVEDSNHCFLIQDSVYILVDAKYSLALPTSFTPNNDGTNDIIYIKGWGIKELKSFKVFNQQGRQVFESNDIELGWDGYSEYGKQPPGLYLYRIEVISYDNRTRVKEGFFYIL